MTEYPKRRWGALAVLSGVSVIVGLDTTVLNVALPTLSGDLGATTTQLQWFADSYLLALAVLLLPAGLLSDLLGRKPLTLASLVIFGLGSAWSAYAPSPGHLIAARTVMGTGAALLLPLTYSWLIALFPEHERSRAMGVLGGAGFAGMPLGPIVGGWLLDNYFWGSVFLINVPCVAAALLAGTILLPPGGRLPARRIDAAGIALSVTGLAALTYGMIEAPARGWNDPTVLLTTIAGLALLTAFTTVEHRREPAHALMDMSLWRLPAFSWGSGCLTLATLLGIVTMFTVPQYFAAVLGTDALGTGIRLLPLFAGILTGIPLGIQAAARIGHRSAVTTGLLLMVLGCALAATTGIHTGYHQAAIWLVLIGLGFGAVLIIGNTLALDTLDETDAATGGAIVQVLRHTGSVTGIAVLGSTLNAVYRQNLHLPDLPPAATTAARNSVESGLAIAHRLGDEQMALAVNQSFLDGLRVQMGLGAALAALCALGTLLFMPAAPTTTAPERSTPA